MKKFLFQAIGLLILLFGALYFYQSNPDITGLPFVPEQPVLKQIQISNALLKVEIADTAGKRTKGLGGRESIASDEGMLFIFPDIQKRSFWMKDLQFPLDLIWIRGETVMDIFPNVPPPLPNQKDDDLPIYQSNKEIDKVLEVSGGAAQRLNIKVGDTVKII